MDALTLLTALGAGVISFISPCVLPLVPGYVSFVSGISLSELAEQSGEEYRERRRRGSYLGQGSD